MGFSKRYRTSSALRPKRWGGVALGMLGTVLLHALLWGTMVLGTPGRHAHAPRHPGIGASAIVSDHEPLGTLIFIDDPAMSRSPEEPLEDLASRGAAPRNPLLTVVSPDPALAATFTSVEESKEKSSSPEEASGDPLGHAMLFGRYMGQIRARIERAWVRPRTPMGEASFECRVRIVQNREGEVREITLERCNRSIPWQLSLVQAIQRASPLPAPPNPEVFTDALSLSFSAQPFSGEAAAQGYEPESTVLAMASPPPASAAAFVPRVGAPSDSPDEVAAEPPQNEASSEFVR